MYTFNDFLAEMQQRLAANESINWHDIIAFVPDNKRASVFNWVNDGRLRNLWTVTVVPDTVRGTGRMPLISRYVAPAAQLEGSNR